MIKSKIDKCLDNFYKTTQKALLVTGPEGKILYLPIYMVAFLEKQVPINLVYKVDLTGLK